MASTSRNGVLAAAVLILVGAAAAGVAWWNTLSQTQQALDYWGPEAAVLVREAPRVAALALTFQKPGLEGAAAAEHDLVHPVTAAQAHVLQIGDISSARGLVHLRHALLGDRSFDWTAAPRDPGDVRYALTFQEDGRLLVVYLSEDFTHLTAVGPFDVQEGDAMRSGDAAAAGKGSAAPTSPIRETISAEPIAEGLKKYFADVLPRKDEG